MIIVFVGLQYVFFVFSEKKIVGTEQGPGSGSYPDSSLFIREQDSGKDGKISENRKGSSTSASDFNWSDGRCEGMNGAVALTASPMNYDDFEIIYPYGTIEAEGGHITPIDHQYYYPKNWNSAPDAYPVFAIADGNIISIGIRNQYVNETGGRNPVPDYRIVFEHSCSFWSYVDLVTSLSPEIAGKTGRLSKDDIYDQIDVRIPVKAGQEIGRIGGRTLDFGVYNSQITLPGFLVLEHYDGEAWKPHTADPYDYFIEPIRSRLMAKTVRSAEPVAGKIDYDIDGKIQGNWFVPGSGGFPLRYVDKNWHNHLAIVPDAFDPDHYVFSSGNIGGYPGSYGIKNPVIAPHEAGMEDDIIKYELASLEYFEETGRPWNRMNFAKGIKAETGRTVRGVVLLKLVGPRRLKVEVFIGKAAGEVSDFTDRAVIYER